MKMRQKREGFKGQRIVVVPRPVLERTTRDPLLKGLLPTDAGYYPKAKGHICAREEGAPETIFIYCAEGKGWCEIGGRCHDVVANQLLVVPAFTPHVYGAAKTVPWTIHWFHAVGTNMPFYLERLGVAKEKPVVSLAGDVYLFSLFEEVVEALEHGFTLTHLLYAAHALAHLMGSILRHKEEHGYGAPSVREQISRSVEFMNGHLSEPLKVPTLAALVNLSRSHYTTLFRRVTGYAPLSYLNHLRMQRAVQLLNSTDLPIKQISEQLGFSEQFYFSRAFSKMYNHSRQSTGSATGEKLSQPRPAITKPFAPQRWVAPTFSLALRPPKPLKGEGTKSRAFVKPGPPQPPVNCPCTASKHPFPLCQNSVSVRSQNSSRSI